MTRFNVRSTALEVATALSENIHGKKVLITGPSIGGIGFEAALSIASQSPKLLVLAGRSREKLDAAAAEINAKYPDVVTRKVELDLSSLSSVRAAAREVLAYPEELDVVIANAAVMALPEYTTTQDGFEMQFGSNHLGHFVFVNSIMPKVLQGTGEKRIVNVASSAHEFSGIRYDDPNFENGAAYDKWLAYGQSKTANILFSEALAEKLGSRGLKAYSLHPGAIWTGLQKHVDQAEWDQWNEKLGPDFKWKTLQEGAATTVVAAFDPSIADKSGAYLADADLAEQSAHAKGSELAQKLWELSEKLVGEKFDY